MSKYTDIESHAETSALIESKESHMKTEDDNMKNSSDYKFAVNASWVVNWFLLVIKFIAVALSNSKAVMAALVDSVVDLVSQAVLSLADQYIARHSPEYPVGRSRLEALSVIACAFIMSMASVEGKIRSYLMKFFTYASFS